MLRNSETHWQISLEVKISVVSKIRQKFCDLPVKKLDKLQAVS